MQIFHIPASDVTAAKIIFLSLLQISTNTVLQNQANFSFVLPVALDYKYKNILNLEVITI
jgi:hypothetical protein